MARKRLIGQRLAMHKVQVKSKLLAKKALLKKKVLRPIFRFMNRRRSKKGKRRHFSVKRKKRRRTAKLHNLFPFSRRLTVYSNVQPFWLGKTLRKQSTRRALRKRYRLLKPAQPWAETKTFFAGLWGHLTLPECIKPNIATTWLQREDKVAKTLRGFNRTISLNCINRFGKFNLKLKITKRLKSIAKLLSPKKRDRRRGALHSKNQKRALKPKNLKSETKKVKTHNKHTKMPRRRRGRKAKTRRAGFSKKVIQNAKPKKRFTKPKRKVKIKYTELAFHIPSHIVRPLVKKQLAKRIKLKLSGRGRFNKRYPINELYVPRIHAKLPFNPK